MNDIPSDEWEVPFQQSIDALLVIADNSKRNLEIIQQQIAISLEEFGKIVHTEQGKVLRHLGRSVEHFGYIDGISQPIFTAEDELKEETLPIVLQEEVDGGHGSYLVFRKLAQHVGKFNRKIRVLAKKLNISEGLAGAQVIGRFKNGKLLTQSDKPWIREFDFGRQEMSSDRTGKRCPFHAHVRKVNPRSREKPILIARRGMTYYEKERRQDLLDEPDEGVGILFMCFQKSIQEQFEFIQQRANNARFPKKGVGIDPIIGQNNNPDRAQNWNPTWNKSSENPVVYDFQEVVTLKGGNYFYAPSLSFLRTIADMPPVSTKAPISTYANKIYWNLAGGTYNPRQFKSSAKVIV